MTSSIEYMVSYGSLLSAFSRKYYSGINSTIVPVLLKGWRRAWCTRYSDENATYAGAHKDTDATIHSVLIPTQITADLRQRERYYDFVKVDQDTIRCHESGLNLPDKADVYWVCKTNRIDYSTVDYPLPQSYVDTCIVGCLEISEQFAWEFIMETAAWDSYWINDRDRTTPIFPRTVKISNDQQQKVDQILDKCGVLQFRSEL